MTRKFRAAAVRYEVAQSLVGNIIWVDGPFMAWANQDVSIFRTKLKKKLLQNEVIVADAIYRDVKCIFNDGINPHVLQTVFSRFKSFNILSNRYRHDLYMHADVFSSTTNLTQLSIEKGAELFSIAEVA